MNIDFTTNIAIEFTSSETFEFDGDNSKLVEGGQITFTEFLIKITPGTKGVIL